MAREVYTDSTFKQFSERFVFLRVLADTDADGPALESRYNVEGFPTILILDSKGREIDRLVGGRSVDELLEELEWIFKYASETQPIHL